MKEKIETRLKMRPLYILLITVIVSSVISFFAGAKYQQSKVPSFNGARMFGNGQNTPIRQNGQRIGRPVSGEVIGVDANSITVKMQDGSTKIVLLAAATTYSKSNPGTKTDIALGQSVAIYGSENSDGSLTAQNVQLSPLTKSFDASQSAIPTMK